MADKPHLEMRKTLTHILLAAMLCCVAANAQERASERTFLTTDRKVYVAGDRLWCSAFCVDASNGGKLSTLSSIAYVELHSAEKLEQTARIALCSGRGAGCITLDADLPTGNYRLIAYTAQDLNETDFSAAATATTISIFNPSTTARVKDGVKVVKQLSEASCAPAAEGQVKLSAGGAKASGVMPLTLSNSGSSAASMSVSVSRLDGIGAPKSLSISDFTSTIKPGTSFTGEHTPEFDGEIIRGKVVGLDPAQVQLLAGKYGFLSAPGDMADVYSAPVMEDGTLTFFTNNIYGDKDIVCEIEGLPKEMPCHIELISPFVDMDAGEIPQLEICQSQKVDLLKRKASMQIEKAFAADTLYERMPMRANHLFGQEGITYRLDDYTRFPLMEEVLVELLPEVRAHKTKGDYEVRMRLVDIYRAQYFPSEKALMLVDGTPVFNHNRLMQYDPMLVEEVEVYPYTYFVGQRQYPGVTNFVTFAKTLPSMEFDANVRIVSFKGASLPMAYTCSGVGSDYPDLRMTALWQPLVDVRAGESITLDCKMPDIAGRYLITVEGLTEDGRPVTVSQEVEVR